MGVTMARGKEIKTGSELQETTRPMAVREITIEDKFEALEARVAALEKIVDTHQKYHFGRSV